LEDPSNWFGELDSKNLLSYEYKKRGNSELDEPTMSFRNNWLKQGLPTHVPELEINYSGAICYADEIVQRIQQIDRE